MRARGQADTAECHRVRGRDLPRQARERELREVRAPAVDLRQRGRSEPNERDAVRRLEAARISLRAQNRHRMDAGREPPVRGERRDFGDGDELRQVLVQHDVRRHCKRRLVVLPARERRPVRLREERHAEADDEERRGDCRVPGVAREREGRQPQRHGRPGRGDGGDEGDQRGQQDQEAPGAAARRELGGCRMAAREPDQDRRERAERRDVQH